MLRVIIVDDEKASRDLLRNKLETESDIEIITECADVGSALDCIPQHHPDVVFLDVEMPPYTGFDLLKNLPDPPRVVLVTGHSGYAIKAFEVAAVDYLLKPVESDRLQQTLQRLRSSIASSSDEASPSPDKKSALVTRRILLRTAKGNVLLPIGSIIAMQADGDYTHVHQTGGTPLLACQLLGRLLPQVDDEQDHHLERIDRSWCLNLDKVQRLETLPNRECRVWMDGLPTSLQIGRTAGTRLRKLLEQNGTPYSS